MGSSIKTYSISINNGNSNSAPSDGFIDNLRLQDYDIDLNSPPGGLDYDASKAKRRGNVRWTEIINQLEMVTNCYITSITSDATATTEAANFAFDLAADDDLLITPDELNPGEMLTGRDCIVRCIARALNTDLVKRIDLFDPTAITTYGVFASGPSGLRTVSDFEIGAYEADLATAEGFVLSRGILDTEYRAEAVHFADGVFLRNDSLDTEDATTFSWSMWLRSTISEPSNFYYFGVFDNGDADLGVGTEPPPALSFYGYWTDNDTKNIYDDTAATLQPNEWTHFFGYVDTTAGTQSIFINGVKQTLTPALGSDDSGFTMPLTGVCVFPYDGAQGGNPDTPEMDFADVWLAPGVYHTDIATFRDPVSGKPMNPSGFPSAAILFSGDASTFGTNQGTGGDFTLTGSLTDADSSPSG